MLIILKKTVKAALQHLFVVKSFLFNYLSGYRRSFSTAVHPTTSSTTTRKRQSAGQGWVGGFLNTTKFLAEKARLIKENSGKYKREKVNVKHREKLHRELIFYKNHKIRVSAISLELESSKSALRKAYGDCTKHFQLKKRWW